MKKILLIGLMCMMGCVFSGNAFALEKPAPFKISKIYMSNATNYHFRIYSDSSSWHCSGGPEGAAWSFINEDDSGAYGKINALKLAYAMGKTVRVYTKGVKHTDGRTFCRIVDLVVY